MSTRMQQRRGTSDQWTTANPTLAEGEFGWESDTNSFKIGDGVNNWSSLEYFQDNEALSASLGDYIEISSLAAPDGVATLDVNGTLEPTQIPSSLATTSYVDGAVSSLIDAAPGALDTLNELAAALNDDANFFTTIGTDISDGDTATLTAAEDYADGLAVNYDPAGAADAAETATNSYTDGEISTLDTSLKAYADTAESDAISTASSDATAKADAAEANAESYTDSLIGDVTVDGTGGNTVTDRIASAVSSLVDSAPGALDTLNELASALNDDENAFTTLTAYADQAELDAVSTSNAYTDSAVAGAQPTFTNNFMLMGA